VLHQDDYFVRPPRTNHAHRVRDLRAVGPHEVDLARLAAHVAAFRGARTAW
jgi:uridine kinase